MVGSGEGVTAVEAAEEHLALTRAFDTRAQELSLSGISGYYWYHTIDLGDGLVTPGLYDYRDTIGAFGFPNNMRGTRVLDVGSATGFFAFEFKRRDASVMSVECPPCAIWTDSPASRSKARCSRSSV